MINLRLKNTIVNTRCFNKSLYVASLSAITTIVNEGESVQLCVNIDEPQDVTAELQIAISSPTLNQGTLI